MSLCPVLRHPYMNMWCMSLAANAGNFNFFEKPSSQCIEVRKEMGGALMAYHKKL